MTRRKSLLLSLLGIAAMAVLLLAVNVLTANLHLRQDVTADKLYTLSQGSRDVLARLDKPVTIRFYFSRSLRVDGIEQAASYASRVEDLLKEYQVAGKGKITVQHLDPKPDSDWQDSARLDGIDGQQLPSGDGFYFGLAVARADKVETIPALYQDRYSSLEYEITRAVSRVAFPQRQRVGVLSNLPVMGSMGNPMMGGRGQREAWAAITDLQAQYDVQLLPPAPTEIPADLQVLLLIHPKNLSDECLFAIDQFLLRGGRVVAFLDPFCAFEAQTNPMGGFQPPSPSSLGPLLGAWGVTMDGDKILADRGAHFRAGNQVMYPAPELGESAMDQTDVITAGLKRVLLLYCGSFAVSAPDGVTVTNLIQSTADAQMVDSMQAFDARSIANRFQSDNKRRLLAVKLAGKFKTAFPDGRPQPKPEEGKEPAPKPEPAAGDSLKASAKDSAIVLVADVDMLQDDLWQQGSYDPITGARYNRIVRSNNDFLQNAVAQLAGDQSLVSIRSKIVTERPFTVVQNKVRQADEKFQAHFKRVEDEMKKVSERINQLPSVQKAQNGRLKLTPELRQEIVNAQKRRDALERENRELRKQYRQEIDQLRINLSLANILAMPLLVILAGVVVAFYKRLGR